MARRRCCCDAPPAVCTRTWTVRGCANWPLPDAVVTMTSPGGIVTSGTTDSSGQVTLAHGASSGTWTATHPSGRFFSNSGGFSGCAGSTSQVVNLFPFTGYQCCTFLGATYPNPYPISNTWTITDSGGSFTASGANCTVNACTLRPNASDVAPDCNLVPDRTCVDEYTGATVQLYRPPEIGTGSINVRYQLTASGGGRLVQSFWQCPATCYWDGGGCPVVYAGRVDYNRARAWRVPGNCASSTSGASLVNFQSTGFTVNSLQPFVVTYHFASGNGYGPNPVQLGGFPYCSSDPIMTFNPYSSDVTISA